MATDPDDPTRAVLASTGRGGRFPSDDWGTTYIVDVEFDGSGDPTSAELVIVYDGDDAGDGQFPHPDYGLRSPDNLDWSKDGFIYLQEDRSTRLNEFGGTSGEEASMWKLHPETGELTRVAQINRSAVPTDQVDTDPTDLGDWESSGVIDVSELFHANPGSLLLFNTQAHSLRGGPIDSENLVQGGQLAFLQRGALTTEPPQMVPADHQYHVHPLFTVGETLTNATGTYTPPGILDGMGAFALNDHTVRVLANHELRSSQGYAYTLANGTDVTGARVSYFDIDKKTHKIVDSGLAYDTIINAAGNEVDETNVDQLGDGGGISRLCSANFVQGGTFNFVDDIFFTGEEDSNSNGGPGGYEYALDAKEGVLYAVPAMGFAAWENVTPLDTGNPDKVALLVGDDREAAPLYLFIGTKDNSPGAGFLERNGLATGKMYAWKADSGETSPEQFNGTGESRTGTWVEITDLTSIANQDAEVASKDGFIFSRPEDVATDPDDPTRAVLASTGRAWTLPVRRLGNDLHRGCRIRWFRRPDQRRAGDRLRRRRRGRWTVPASRLRTAQP